MLTMGTLPLGFRFRPTDEELINHYLRLKINGRHSEIEVIPEIDVCKWEPWDMPGIFFSLFILVFVRQKKNRNYSVQNFFESLIPCVTLNSFIPLHLKDIYSS